MINEKKLRGVVRPLMKYKKYLEFVYVYGSSVYKKKPNDIDILVVLNDVGKEKITNQIVDLIHSECKKIQKEANKKGWGLHFQSPKLLSHWWELLVKGRPWIISSLKKIIVIYDNHYLLKEAQDFVRTEKLQKTQEKSEKLLERSDDTIMDNRRKLLESISKLTNAATEAAQVLLLFNKKIILNKKRIASELEKKEYISKLGNDEVGSYRELVDLEDKVEKGHLSEFSVENLTYYEEKTQKLINKVEDLLTKRK